MPLYTIRNTELFPMDFFFLVFNLLVCANKYQNKILFDLSIEFFLLFLHVTFILLPFFLCRFPFYEQFFFNNLTPLRFFLFVHIHGLFYGQKLKKRLERKYIWLLTITMPFPKSVQSNSKKIKATSIESFNLAFFALCVFFSHHLL